MPELPEVETLRRQLCEIVLGEEIVDFGIHDARIGVMRGLHGRTISSVLRHGKALVMKLDDNTELLLQLRMTGRLLWQENHHVIPHTRFVISFPHGTLSCIDPRRFATFVFHKNRSPQAIIGDPLKTRWASAFYGISCARRTPVKALLMDQRVIAGIGNIYACEILHAAAINPMRPACNVRLEEIELIEKAGRDILKKAIECRGTSVSDWRDLFGLCGEYQDELKVYKREGLSCMRCGGTICRIRMNGRGTYFCPHCQK